MIVKKYYFKIILSVSRVKGPKNSFCYIHVDKIVMSYIRKCNMIPTFSSTRGEARKVYSDHEFLGPLDELEMQNVAKFNKICEIGNIVDWPFELQDGI